MSLDFSHVSLLTYQHTPVLFDAGLRYKIQKTFTIEGILAQLDALEGVGATWSQAQFLQLNAQDYQPIILNGIDFGMGKIVSIDFTPGTHVKVQKYIYQINAYSEGNLFNAVSNEYADIDWSTIHCIDHLDETFNYNVSDTGDKSYDHSISIRYNKNVDNLSVSPIDLAKTLAENLMSALNLTYFLGSYSTQATSHKIYTETYNKIDSSCSFVEHIVIPANQIGNYSLTLSYDVQLNEKGITNVTEKGIIQGIADPIFASATAGYTAQTPSVILTRVTNVYNIYAFSTLPLSNIVIQNHVTINKFDGIIQYEQLFTNDPRVNDYAIWDYTTKVTRSIDNYIEVSESGKVAGIGRPRADKYPNALAFYNSTVCCSNMAARILTAYNTFGGTKSASFKLIKSSFAEADFIGQIDYSATWTDNNLYITDDLIRREEISVNTAYPIQVVSTTNVVNFKQVIQPQNSNTQGKRSISVKLKGIRTATMNDYVNFASNLITGNGYNIIGTDPYISNCNYSLSPNRNEFALNVDISFQGFYKYFEDLTMT